MHTMPVSVESGVRSRMHSEIDRRPKAGIGRRSWTLVGALVVGFVVVFLLLRQQPVTAAETATKAETTLAGISTYHLKYRSTSLQPNGAEYTAHYEWWYAAPDRLRSTLTQQGSTQEYLVKGNGNWIYNRVSKTAFVTPISTADAQNKMASVLMPSGSPGDILKGLRKGYKYVGTERIGDWECDVVEGQFPNDRHVKTCIDRKTGVLVQHVVTEKGRLVSSEDIEVLEVNQPVSADVFELHLPKGALLIKASSLDNELFNADLSGGPYGLEEPSAVTAELTQLAKQGTANKAKLSRLFEPGFVPGGYKLAGVGTYGERHESSDGSVRVDLLGGYNTAYIDYLNPHTGDTVAITISASKLDLKPGRAIAVNGSQGWIETHKDPFPYTEVCWQSGDTYLLVSASSIGEKDVLEIAESLHPLGKAPHK